MTLQLDHTPLGAAPVLEPKTTAAAASSPVAPAPAAVVPAPAAPPAAVPATTAPPVGRRQRRALSPEAVRLLSVVPVLAYVVCVAIQPLPPDPQPVLPWWYAAVDIASLAALVVACLALGRVRSWAPLAVVAAGVGMIAETITCPASGHHTVLGWWWYVQLTLSVAVLLGGLALRRAYPRISRS